MLCTHGRLEVSLLGRDGQRAESEAGGSTHLLVSAPTADAAEGRAGNEKALRIGEWHALRNAAEGPVSWLYVMR